MINMNIAYIFINNIGCNYTEKGKYAVKVIEYLNFLSLYNFTMHLAWPISFIRVEQLWL